MKKLKFEATLWKYNLLKIWNRLPIYIGVMVGILLASCTKTWKCTVSSKYGAGDWIETGTVNFTGTKDEMKDYEQTGTITTTIGESEYKVSTDCK